LIYGFSNHLNIGTIVFVPLKTTTKEAVVIEVSREPNFQTLEIISITDKYYSKAQADCDLLTQ